MGWYNVYTLWGGIPYILYGVVYRTYSMEWYIIHILWSGILYILYGVVYCTYYMEWYIVLILWWGMYETPLFHMYVRKIYCILYVYIEVYITVVSVYLRNGLCHNKEVLDSRDMVYIIFIYYFMIRLISGISSGSDVLSLLCVRVG